MAFLGHISYDPRTDPKAMFTQGVENMLAGIEQQFEKKRQIGDVRDVAKYIQGGLQGEPPTPKTEIGMQLMGRIAMQQAAQAMEPPSRTKIQELTDEGYSPQEAKMIRDISHGIKPRASTRQQYENMTEIEKLDFLSKVKQRAEGQYYGTEEKIKVRDPILLDWTLRELNKLPQYQRQQSGAGTPALGPGASAGVPGVVSATAQGEGAAKLTSQYPKIFKSMSAEDRAAIDAAWNKAAKSNVTVQEFLAKWRELYGHKD